MFMRVGQRSKNVIPRWLTPSLCVWLSVRIWAEMKSGWLPEIAARSHAKCIPPTGQEPSVNNVLYSSTKWGLPIVKLGLLSSCAYFNLEKLTSFIKDATWRAVRGVCSAGLTTTVFPQLSAGPIFQMSITNGKFH